MIQERKHWIDLEVTKVEFPVVLDDWNKISDFKKGGRFHQQAKDYIKKKKSKRRIVKQSKKKK